MPTTLINVSNRLPVTVTEQGVKKSSGGLVAALEALDRSTYDLKWFGWPGGEIAADRQAEVTQQLQEQTGCTPIYLSKDEAEGHYEGFSNGSLWPLLHYMPGRFHYRADWWDQYKIVNQRFADAVAAAANDEDLVWVHDYQLMLLPLMLKKLKPTLRIGFFLHTPFPSFEVFRCHPRREELLVGLLGADLIGFHTFGYLRHFRSSAMRLLGVETEFTQIRHGQGRSTLGVYPIGINAPAFEAALDSPDCKQQVERFRSNFNGKRLVLSVERLDYTKGLPERLDAIDLFLAGASEEIRNGIKFIFVSVPSRENVDEYQSLLEEVESRVGRLNGKYTTLTNSPVHFIHGSVQFAELCALYALSEVCMVTPLMDGMNLVAKEYIICQRDEPGVLVLSEFAGSAEELFNATLVNPYDAQSVADALAAALAMPRGQRKLRMDAMRDRVRTMDARAWAKSFIDDLTARPEPDASNRPISEAREQLTRALKAGRRIALFLDYDGTLREFEQTPEAARPSAAVIDLLKQLARRAIVQTTIISGRSHLDLEAFFADFPMFAFIAEHGAKSKARGAMQWTDQAKHLNFDWKADVAKVLYQYADATPGAFVEDKETSLVWHYRKADPEFGQYKARQLMTDLTTALANLPVTVRHGRKIVEITPLQVNKGQAVADALESNAADVVVMIGDDATDEAMFKLQREKSLSIKVGEGDTAAHYRLPTPQSVRRFLSEIFS